jgi:hypothetical protein
VLGPTCVIWVTELPKPTSKQFTSSQVGPNIDLDIEEVYLDDGTRLTQAKAKQLAERTVEHHRGVEGRILEAVAARRKNDLLDQRFLENIPADHIEELAVYFRLDLAALAGQPHPVMENHQAEPTRRGVTWLCYVPERWVNNPASEGAKNP